MNDETVMALGWGTPPNERQFDALATRTSDGVQQSVQQSVQQIVISRARKQTAYVVVESLKANEGTVAIRFHPDSPVNRELLVRLATGSPWRFGLRPGGVFTLALQAQDWGTMVDGVDGFLLDLEAAQTGDRASHAAATSSGAGH